jgi:hypothetical protein
VCQLLSSPLRRVGGLADRRALAALGFLLGVLLAHAALPRAASAEDECNDYTCAEYAEHDQDNMWRARGRQISESTSPDYHREFAGACADSAGRAAGK